MITVPSSKSIANRSLILASLRKGKTRLKGDFQAEDIQIMIRALRKLGIRIDERADLLIVTNDFLWRSSVSCMTLYLGNSGTSMRFLTALCAFRNGETILTGNARMLDRPIADLVEALRQCGVQIEYLRKKGFPPLLIHGHGFVRGGKVTINGNISSQFISALLMIAPVTQQGIDLKIISKLVSKPYVYLTMNVMKEFSQADASKSILHSYTVPGDASAAVYWRAFGFLHGVPVRVPNLPENDIQPDSKFADVLQQLKKFHGTQFSIDMGDMPDASLMLMAMAVTVLFPVKITGIGTLRVKECDRIEAMATELRRIGARVKTGRDWIAIWPLTKIPQKTIMIRTYNDHRIAMSMAILRTKIKNLKIQNPKCVNKSYPNFWRTLEKIL